MNTPSRRDGSALLMVIGFVLVEMILAGGVVTYAMNNSRLAKREELMERALHLAEAGVEEAAQYIVDLDAYLYQNSTSVSGSMNGGSYQGVIHRKGFRSYSISCVGTVSGIKREVDINEVYVPTFAKFGWWSRVNGPIWFVAGDVLDGSVHTDDVLRFNTSSSQPGPIFDGNLTSDSDYYYLRRDNDGERTYTTRSPAESSGVEFNEGFDLSSAQGSMASVSWASKEALAGNGAYTNGLLLEGATEIEFEGKRMRITNAARGWSDHPIHIGPEQLVFVKDRSSSDRGNVTIKGGVVDGQLTIFSEDDIFLKNHVTYQNDPRDDALPIEQRDYDDSSDDALGLVSKDDVWVHPDAPNNLQIFAAIMATGARSSYEEGSFGVYDYATHRPAGALTVYGSLVQDVRGPVGTFNSRGIVSGYFKDCSWDKRFDRTAPPHYPPLSEKIIMKGWSEKPAT